MRIQLCSLALIVSSCSEPAVHMDPLALECEVEAPHLYHLEEECEAAPAPYVEGCPDNNPDSHRHYCPIEEEILAYTRQFPVISSYFS